MGLFREKERYAILGAVYEVHKILGNGFSEFVYQDALEIELKERNIPFEREKKIVPLYKGVLCKHTFACDFVCYDDIIVECKAVESLLPIHEAQLINYLKVTGFQVGLLINFKDEFIRPKALINNVMSR